VDGQASATGRRVMSLQTYWTPELLLWIGSAIGVVVIVARLVLGALRRRKAPHSVPSMPE
jgi:hypothetical protein